VGPVLHLLSPFDRLIGTYISNARIEFTVLFQDELMLSFEGLRNDQEFQSVLTAGSFHWPKASIVESESEVKNRFTTETRGDADNTDPGLSLRCERTAHSPADHIVGYSWSLGELKYHPFSPFKAILESLQGPHLQKSVSVMMHAHGAGSASQAREQAGNRGQEEASEEDHLWVEKLYPQSPRILGRPR
jgi:hypothetical protein